MREFVIEAGAAVVHQGGLPRVVHDVSIRIVGDRIVEISEGRIVGTVRRVAAMGQLVLPGFISGHTHVSVGTYTRGLIEGGAGTWVPHEVVEELPDEDLRSIIEMNAIELVRSGVTTTLNMEHNVRRERLAVDVARSHALRTYPSAMAPGVDRLPEVWFRPRGREDILQESVAGTLAEIEDSLEFGLAVAGGEEGRILPQIGFHAPDTQTAETVSAAISAAKKLGNGLHIHLSQNASERDRVLDVHGLTPVQWMSSLGLFEVPVFAAHMAGCIPSIDMPILASNDVFFSTCPTGEGPGGLPQPWPEALGAGVASGPAIDTHSNDMVENIKLAVLHGQARYELMSATSAAVMRRPTIEDAVLGCTQVIADRLKRPDLGRLEVDAKADIVGVDVSSFPVGSGTVGPRPLWNLLYANASAVRTVVVDGLLHVVDGVYQLADEGKLRNHGAGIMREILNELQVRGHDFDKPNRRTNPGPR